MDEVKKEQVALEPLSETDRAYLAGFLDGEGCIMAGYRQAILTLLVTIGQCDESIMKWLVQHLGGSYRLTKKREAHHKNFWEWRQYGCHCRRTLEAIRPYLKLKAPQCELALALVELMEKYPNGKHRSSQDALIGQHIVTKLGALNRMQGKHADILEA